MRRPTSHFPALCEMLNFTSKRELTRHSKTPHVHQQDLVALILAAQHGSLIPYRYANHFERVLPEHLHPNDAEHAAIAANGVGPFKSRGARKFTSKLFQLFREQRTLAAHLFYTPDHRYWHLFYFDNRDTEKQRNHWKHGPHIHFVSDLWPELSFEVAWAQVLAGNLAFPNKLHLRYINRE
jgi:hypothetical protein